MKIVITYTDDRATAQFVECPGGIWGLYDADRMDVNAWILAGRRAMEERWIDVVTGGQRVEDMDEHDYNTWRWVNEECPLVALAIMCGEWGAPPKNEGR